MKKYVKPELFYERYELSTHVAACNMESVSTDENNCAKQWFEGRGWNFPGSMFSDDVSCSYGIEFIQQYCYTNAQDTLNQFVS